MNHVKSQDPRHYGVFDHGKAKKASPKLKARTDMLTDSAVVRCGFFGTKSRVRGDYGVDFSCKGRGILVGDRECLQGILVC